ncbi:zinc-binding alcohol dehydrogenase family protein [Pantoea sp. Tr-811]|uniref:quinone oxidoreductase family protein n=1 Tax=Pantoea sp. Tr-811 TaxID=2608361 RepID=UPI00196248AC|nr:zinc-binding alcohol dehydrogenase family protein [Pantoea sp. Tr-811]
MKALVASRFGSPAEMTIEDRPMPSLKPGYSLVRIHAATVNPLSSQVRSGIVSGALAPLVLSNDGAGIVEESTLLKRGTRVAVYGGATLGIKEDGLQQQWAVIENNRLFELPNNISLDEGAALPINYVTAYQALTRVGQVKAGQRVLVSGASGALGHALIQTALALGAVPIGIVSSTPKVSSAHHSGAAVVIDLSRDVLKDAVFAATEGKGADLAFDPVGGELLGSMVAALRARGALISIGFVGGMSASIDVADLVIEEKRILGYDA